MLHDRARPYKERFERGAMKPSDDTVMLYGHDDSGVPLARVGAGSLRFEQADEGLRFAVSSSPNHAPTSARPSAAGISPAPFPWGST